MNKIGTHESEFVKDKRKNHCKGCINENGWCTAQEVLMCWLRMTYLPKDEWYKAMMSDMETKYTNEITDEINKTILDDVLNKKKPNKKKRKTDLADEIDQSVLDDLKKELNSK